MSKIASPPDYREDSRDDVSDAFDFLFLSCFRIFIPNNIQEILFHA